RHTMPASREATEFDETDQLTWGADSSFAGAFWCAIEEPGNLGGFWTVTGAGTDILNAQGAVQISTSAAQTRYYSRTAAEDPDSIAVEFGMRITDGDGSVTSDDISVRIVHSDASTYERDISIRLMHNKYRVWDNVAGAQIGSDEPVDFTTKKHLRVVMSKGSGGVDKVKTWWVADAHAREFVEGPGGDATDTTGPYATNNTYEWGHRANAGSLTLWAHFGYCNWATRWNERATLNPGGVWTNPTHLHGGIYPTLPALLFDGVKVCAKSGPTAIAEIQNIQTDYDYPVDALFPSTHPSPRRPWRSTADNVDMAFVFDLEGDHSAALLDATTIAMFLFGSNIRSAKLRRRVGAAWTDVLELNGADGFAALKYVTDGRKVQPDASQVTQGERWFWYNALRGAQLDLGAGADADRYKRISANTEGSWVGTGGTTKRPVLTLHPDDLTGAEAASGTALLWPRTHGALRHEYTEDEDVYQFFIPAQKTAEGYYEIGAWVAGDVNILARPYDWGYSTATAHNVEVAEQRDGTRAAVRRGPPRRTFRFAWMHTAVDETQPWTTDPSPDYVAGSTSGEPVATPSSTLRMLEGFLDRQDGAVGLAVLLLNIPSGTGAKLVVGREEAILGRLLTSPTRENVQGDEGTDEVSRLNEFTFSEEV
ncbi:hypothetical protein HN937_09375, partial [Candidatus Poribacteria bacterium]|nr:hypothetical protein [Candidatus Poribacteria bacterium]